jgi:hypothetical protein
MIMLVVYWGIFEQFECYLGPYNWDPYDCSPFDCNESVWLVPGTFE